MELLIFKTDIKTKKKVKLVKPVFKRARNIIDWSIDIEDIDNVLRIECNDGLKENDVIKLMNTYGFYCQALSD